jgi:hypothetical protein
MPLSGSTASTAPAEFLEGHSNGQQQPPEKFLSGCAQFPYWPPRTSAARRVLKRVSFDSAEFDNTTRRTLRHEPCFRLDHEPRRLSL